MQEYKTHLRRWNRTRIGAGSSFEHIRECWAAATYIQHNKKIITLRGIKKLAKISSTSIVGMCMKYLIGCGYIARGPRRECGTWVVRIPLSEPEWYKEN